MPALDRYDAEDLDEDDYDPMSIQDRVAAEQELRRRDREEGRNRRDDRDLLYGKDVFIMLCEFAGRVISIIGTIKQGRP